MDNIRRIHPADDIGPAWVSDPRPPGSDRALALMKEAYAILENLVETGQVKQGSVQDCTLESLDNAIGMLDDDD
jgi:hypothetical protein